MMTKLALSIVSGCLGLLTGWGVVAVASQNALAHDVSKAAVPAVQSKLPAIQPVDHSKNIAQVNGDLQEIKNEIIATKADLQQAR
jgi:spore maturation protein SpmA